MNEGRYQPVDHKGFWMVVFQWILSQCGTLGNDMTDNLDQEALNFPSPEQPITNEQEAVEIKRKSCHF
jgi:hypothetical protein